MCPAAFQNPMRPKPETRLHPRSNTSRRIPNREPDWTLLVAVQLQPKRLRLVRVPPRHRRQQRPTPRRACARRAKSSLTLSRERETRRVDDARVIWGAVSRLKKKRRAFWRTDLVVGEVEFLGRLEHRVEERGERCGALVAHLPPNSQLSIRVSFSTRNLVVSSPIWTIESSNDEARSVAFQNTLHRPSP